MTSSTFPFQRIVQSIVITMSFLSYCISSSAWAGPFQVSERLNSANVVILGWVHSFGNSVVPSYLSAELEEIRSKHKISIVVEEGYPIDIDHSLESAKQLYREANRLGIPLIPGDLPSDGFDFLASLVALAAGKHSPNWDARNLNFSHAIQQQILSGRKVILLIGRNHIEYISAILKQRGINSSNIDTTLDDKTREVKMGDVVLGIAAPDPLLDKPSFTAIRSNDCASLFKTK